MREKIRYLADEILKNGRDIKWWRMRFRGRVLYPTLGRLLPREVVAYNGIPILRRRFSQRSARIVPEFKKDLILATELAVQRGDVVVIIGGGVGVSTGAAAWATGPSGRVIVHEAGERHCRLNEEVAENCGFGGRIKVEQSIVGEAKEIYSDFSSATTIQPEQLDAGDVLIMDCEGAEESIIAELTNWPRAIVVEVHPQYEVDEARLCDRLTKQYGGIERFSTHTTSYSVLLAAEDASS